MAQLQLQLGLLKFEEIRTALKTYFNEIRGIDYADGNNFSILLDGLSYLQEMMSYQLSQQASNNFIRTSTDRKTAVENSYKLGYVPHRKIPNRLNVIGMTTTNSDRIFFGQKTGLPFVVKSGTTIAVQEESMTLQVAGTNLPNQKVVIPSKNISSTQLTVRIGGSVFTQFDIFDQIPDSSSKIYFLSEVDEFTVITFGNGLIGYMPTKDDTLTIEYFETFGTDGNDETHIELASDTSVVYEAVSEYSGRGLESMESIIVNASKYHSSRGRLITKNDYSNFYRSLGYQSVDVSENNSGINYYYSGNIYVSAVPSNLISPDIDYLTEELAKTTSFDPKKLLDWYDSGNSLTFVGTLIPSVLDDSLVENKKIIGTNSIMSSPTYMYCDITPRVESTIPKYKFPTTDLLKMRNTLMSFALTEMSGFDSDFRTDMMSKELFRTSENVKSVDYDIDYSIVTDLDNITDTFNVDLPKSFVATNDDYYVLDNNFLGTYYERTNQPLDRHVVYSELNTKVVSGFSFGRKLYNGNQIIDNRNFQSALVFDFDSNLSVKFYNKQSFKIFGRGSSYVFSLSETSGVLSVTTTTGNNPVTRTIGTVVVENKVPRIVLDDDNIDWTELVNFTITKTNKTKYHIEIRLEGTTNIGDNSGRQYMTIDSKVKIGRLFVNEFGKIDLSQSNMGEFSVKTDVNDGKKLNFIINNDVIFYAYESAGSYSIVDVNFNISTLDFPTIVGDEIWITEKYVHGTFIGEFDTESDKISLDRIVTGKNNPNITTFINLRDYLTNYQIMTAGTKYKIGIKPKYIVTNNNLIYNQDFDRKNGIYKILNINTLANK